MADRGGILANLISMTGRRLKSEVEAAADSRPS
jgi:hypothetical protein